MLERYPSAHKIVAAVVVGVAIAGWVVALVFMVRSAGLGDTLASAEADLARRSARISEVEETLERERAAAGSLDAITQRIEAARTELATVTSRQTAGREEQASLAAQAEAFKAELATLAPRVAAAREELAAPTPASSAVIDSSGWWLRPSLQRTNSMPMSTRLSITMASWPAPLNKRLGTIPSAATAASSWSITHGVQAQPSDS